MCEHLNIIEDYTTGTVVCIDCAFVRENILLLHPCTSLTDTDIYVNESVTLKKKKKLAVVHDFIENCADKMQIPYAIVELIKNTYSQYRSKVEFDSVKDNILAAYVFYTTLKEEKIGKCIKDISYYTGVSNHSIWKCETLNSKITRFISVDDLVASKSYAFKLLPKDVFLISKAALACQEKHYSPSTIAATLVYRYCMHKGRKQSMKNVAVEFNISTMSIYRCMKYVTVQYFNYILASNKD